MELPYHKIVYDCSFYNCKPYVTCPNGTIMSSPPNARISSNTERRTATDNASLRPRAPSVLSGSKNGRSDGRRMQSPPGHQSTSSGSTHRKTTSNSQRMKPGVEERRTERVQVTTRETLTSRAKSPDRRRPPSMQQQERPRPSGSHRATSGDTRPRVARSEPPQCKVSSNYYHSLGF